MRSFQIYLRSEANKLRTYVGARGNVYSRTSIYLFHRCQLLHADGDSRRGPDRSGMRRRRGACSGTAGSPLGEPCSPARALDDDISARTPRRPSQGCKHARGDFLDFVRRLTGRTLRYYRPALILGTRALGPTRSFSSRLAREIVAVAAFPK